MSDFLVSIVIPVFNGAGTITDTLSTVASQTVVPAEVIVVDDGSQDGSAEIVEGFATDHALGFPIKVMRQENAGQSAARNAAAAVASGELLAFLDQDDQWYRTHLAELCAPFADDEELGWTYSDFDEIDQVGRMVTRGYISVSKVEHPLRTLGDMLRQNLMIVPSATVIRATAFREVGGYDPRLCGYEDDDLMIRLFQAGWDSWFSERALTRFRVHSASSSKRLSFQQSRVRFLDKLIESVPNQPRLNRFYIRDLVFPRLWRTTLIEYSAAVSVRDYERASELALILTELSRRSPGGRKRELELALLARPEAFRRALGIYQAVPGPMRPHINPAFLPGGRRRRRR